MVAMSGAIMPAPLAMPLIVTSTPPIFALAVATFGKVSVVMIALAASSQPPGAAFAASSSSTPSNLLASSGSPMTPGRGQKDLVLVGADRLGGEFRRQFGRFAARLAGEGVGVAGIDHQGAGAAAAAGSRGTSRPARTGIWTW